MTFKGAIWGTIVSVAVVGWIMIGSYTVASTESKFKLPSSVENCQNTTISGITGNATLQILAELDDSFSIYQLAFPWYGVLGTIILFAVAIPVSYLTGSEDVRELGPRLISPVAHWMLPKEILKTDIQLQIVSKRFVDYFFPLKLT